MSPTGFNGCWKNTVSLRDEGGGAFAPAKLKNK